MPVVFSDMSYHICLTSFFKLLPHFSWAWKRSSRSSDIVQMGGVLERRDTVSSLQWKKFALWI